MTLIRADKAMYENRKSALPCGKAVRHVQRGKCSTQPVPGWGQQLASAGPGGTQAGTQPREVQWRPCLGLPFTSDWEQVAEARAGRERGVFSVGLVIIAGCLM